MDINYQSKYLKYKNKYTDLLHLLTFKMPIFQQKKILKD
jgi:hypothetical protein